MKALIASYEVSHRRIMSRIHELNAQLAASGLQTEEREKLTARREMLTIESIELMHIIADLRSHH